MRARRVIDVSAGREIICKRRRRHFRQCTPRFLVGGPSLRRDAGLRDRLNIIGQFGIQAHRVRGCLMSSLSSVPLSNGPPTYLQEAPRGYRVFSAPSKEDPQAGENLQPTICAASPFSVFSIDFWGFKMNPYHGLRESKGRPRRQLGQPQQRPKRRF